MYHSGDTGLGTQVRKGRVLMNATVPLKAKSLGLTVHEAVG